jgi:hypothetical protein
MRIQQLLLRKCQEVTGGERFRQIDGTYLGEIANHLIYEEMMEKMMLQ